MGFRGSAAVAPPVHDPLPIERAAVEGFPLSFPLVLPLILQPLPRRASRDRTNSARFDRMSRVLNAIGIRVVPGHAGHGRIEAPGLRPSRVRLPGRVT